MKVSVYCTVYNHEKYLRSALEGFVSQRTNFDYEVIVHDDASTDGSRAIIEEYAARYPRIIKPIYQQENQYSKGINVVETYLLPRLTGDYVAVCEGDDYWTDPEKLQLQADFLDSHPDYVACAHNTVMLNMQTGAEEPMFHHAEDRDITFEEAAERGSGAYHTSALMYRLPYAANRPAFFQKAKGFGDYPLAIYLTLSGKVRFLNRTMSVYRRGTESSWTNASMAQLEKTARHNQYVVDMLEEVENYTNGAHHELLQGLILKYKYLNLEFDEQYAKLRKPPYDKIFKSKPLKYRLKIYARQYFNGLYQLYRKKTYGKSPAGRKPQGD